MKKAAFIVLAAAAMLAGGCQYPGDDNKVKLALYPTAIKVTLPSAEKDTLPKELDYHLMSNVMSEIIVSGAVDSVRFDIFRKDLVKALQMLNAFGPDIQPQSFETLSDKMAYWYNARALWAMYLSVTYGPKLKDYYLSSPEDAFYAIKFPVDGRMMTLKNIDDEIFRLGGYLSLISAPGVLSGRAAIPEASFQPKDFPGIIRSRFNDFIADRYRVDINVADMQVIVPRIIWQFRQKIIADYQQRCPSPDGTFLLALSAMTSEIARFRLKDAIGYKCVEAPAKQTFMVTGSNSQPTGFLGL